MCMCILPEKAVPEMTYTCRAGRQTLLTHSLFQARRRLGKSLFLTRVDACGVSLLTPFIFLCNFLPSLMGRHGHC